MLALGSFGDGRTDSLFWGLGLGLENQYLPPHLIPSTSNTLKQLGTCAMVTRVAGDTCFTPLQIIINLVSFLFRQLPLD